jgi:RluA family pseudouridine synthase
MIPILFQNDDVVAADKPCGLPSIHAGEGRECLHAVLSRQIGGRLWTVHRLDKDASGVILFARNAAAHRCLNLQFDKRTVRKEYLAVVHGSVGPDSGQIASPVRPFGSGRMGVDPARGKPCLTDFRVEERLGAYTLLGVEPHTGRRHQIRVHLYAIGHPIVGDPLYGERGVQRGYGRLMLHARRIAFVLPTGTEVAVESPVPPDFSVLLDRLRHPRV